MLDDSLFRLPAISRSRLEGPDAAREGERFRAYNSISIPLRSEENRPELGDVFVVVVRDAAEDVPDETVPCDELSENAAYRSRFIREALREFLKVGAGEPARRS